MKNKNVKQKVISIVILVIVILFLIYLTQKLFPIFAGLASEQGRIDFKTKIEGLGASGIFMIIGLMLAQVLLPILPGEPVEVLAGMCFGTFGGLLLITIGAILSATIIIFAVKKFGRKFIYLFVSEDKIKKLEDNKIFKDEKRLNFIIFILFFIPGTPKDLLVYIGGLLPVDSWKFILISSFARFPSIISSTIAGASLVDGNWGAVIAAYAVTFIISGIIVVVFRKREPNIKTMM